MPGRVDATEIARGNTHRLGELRRVELLSHRESKRDRHNEKVYGEIRMIEAKGSAAFSPAALQCF